MSDKPRAWQQDLFYIAVFNVFLFSILLVSYLLGHPLPAATSIAGSNSLIAIVLLIRRLRGLHRVWRATRQHQKDDL